MGQKLLWAGLTLIQTGFIFKDVPAIQTAGAVIMVIALVLYLLDR